MANSSGVVGVLRALLTADTAQFDTSMRKAAKTTETTTTAIGGLTKEVQKLTPQAERMVKAFSGERLLASANNLVAAVERSGGAAKLTEAQQKRVNATLTEAIAKYKALGVAAPQALIATEKATRGAASATSILQSAFATLTASFSTALIVNRVVGGLTSLVNEAVASAGALADLRKTTGLSITTLQQMEFVADQTTGTLDNFTSAAFKLGVNIASGTKTARAAFDDLAKSSDALGMSFEAFQRLTPDEQWNRITKALLAVEDEQERNRLGVALMGKQYQQVASAIAQNYQEIAKGAKLSTDAQILEIDRALDAWRKFVKDTTISFQSTIGNALLWARALHQAVEEMGVFSSTASVVARAQQLLDQGLLDARTKDIALTKQSAQAHANYVAQLRAVQAELAALTPAQLAEIDAARKLHVETSELEKEYHLSEGALSLLDTTTKAHTASVKDLGAEYAKLADISARAFGLDKVAQARDTVAAIGGLAGVVLMDANAVKGLNALLNEAIDAAERNGQLVPLEWLRIEEATRANVGTLQDYLKLLGDVPAAMNAIPPPPELIPFKSELDQERMRKLLEMNAPGTGILREAAERGGETLGHQMAQGIGRAFERVPHFLISSVLHSGGFLNGLKALGIDMADAIVEPLIKRFIAKIASAKLFDAVTGGATGAVVGAGAAAAGGTAAAAGGAGAAAGGGGGIGAAVGGFLTNPVTGIVAGAAVGGALLFRHFRKGNRANDIRDKDLAQFKGFDTTADKADTANPPGFHGLDRLLTKHQRHELLQPFISAKSPGDVRRAFAPIKSFVATLGRNVQSFHSGGVVDDKPMNNRGEVLIKALKHEAVLTPEATSAIGGKATVDAINDQPSVAKRVGSFVNRIGRSAGSAIEHINDMSSFVTTKHVTSFTRRALEDVTTRTATDYRKDGELSPARTAVGIYHSGGIIGGTARTTVNHLIEPWRSMGHGYALSPTSALQASPMRAMAMGLSAITPAPMSTSSPVGNVSMSPASLVTPSASTSSSINRQVNLHMDIRAIDAQDISRFVRSRDFINPLREALKLNQHGVSSTLRYVTTGEP